MRIGELARSTGLTPDTIRYYERLGLLPRVPRRPSGYREYPEGAVMRIRIIQNAARLGFPLKEIARFLCVRDDGGAPCDQVRAYGGRLLQQMDERIRELTEARAAMAATLRQWDQRLSATPPGSRAHLLEGTSPADNRRPQKTQIGLATEGHRKHR